MYLPKMKAKMEGRKEKMTI
jgi:hypothetical protein